MNETIILVIGIIAGFLIALFKGRATSNKADAKMINLANVIKLNTTKLVLTEKEANDKVKEYQDALRKYDPNFHDDDGSGKPSA